MFEGLLLCNKLVITNRIEFLRLWIHEAHRIYSDRFLTNNDQDLFIKILNEKLAFYFDQVYHNVCQNREAPIYSDILRTDGIYAVKSRIFITKKKNIFFFNRKFLIMKN